MRKASSASPIHHSPFTIHTLAVFRTVGKQLGVRALPKVKIVHAEKAFPVSGRIPHAPKASRIINR